jgi:hypothetical protein
VRFGKRRAKLLRRSGRRRLVVAAPRGSGNSVVTVRTRAGTSAANAAAGFTYLPSVTRDVSSGGRVIGLSHGDARAYVPLGAFKGHRRVTLRETSASGPDGAGPTVAVTIGKGAPPALPVELRLRLASLNASTQGSPYVVVKRGGRSTRVPATVAAGRVVVQLSRSGTFTVRLEARRRG